LPTLSNEIFDDIKTSLKILTIIFLNNDGNMIGFMAWWSYQ